MDSIDTHELIASVKQHSTKIRPPIREIVVVIHHDHARSIGFKQDGTFCADPSIMAWYTDRGPNILRGLRLQRVTIYDVRRYIRDKELYVLREAIDILRHALEPNGIWMEF